MNTKVVSRKNPNVIPIMLLNKSDGGMLYVQQNFGIFTKIDEEIDVFRIRLYKFYCF